MGRSLFKQAIFPLADRVGPDLCLGHQLLSDCREGLLPAWAGNPRRHGGLLGTDPLGHDILSRLLYSGVTLLGRVALASVVSALIRMTEDPE